MASLKILVLLLTVSLLPFVSTGVEAVAEGLRSGHVMARAIVLDENGQPILVAYNDDGSESHVVDVPSDYSGQIGQLAIVPAADYRFHQQRLDDYLQAHVNDLALGAEVLSAAAYNTHSFLAADNTTPIHQSRLSEVVKSVLVRGQGNRLVADPSSLILMEFPFDLSQEANVTDAHVTLIVSPEGAVVARSDKPVAYRSGFYGDPNEPQSLFRYSGPRQGDQVFGGVEGALVKISEIFPGSTAASFGPNGKYHMRYWLGMCPVGGFTFTSDTYVHLRYKNFLPVGAPSIPYYIRRQAWDTCFAALGPMGTYMPLVTISPTRLDFHVDVTMLSGRIQIRNHNDEAVTIGDHTVYTAFQDEAGAISLNELGVLIDFNGDGVEDTVVKGKKLSQQLVNGTCETVVDGEGNPLEVFVKESDFCAGDTDPDLQGIYFDAASEYPDFVKLIDTQARIDDNDHIGLLESISENDLQNTDVLIFRESTGELVTERRGLRDAEVNGRVAVEYHEEAEAVAYRVMLRGARDSDLNVGGGSRRGGYSEWAARSLMTEPFSRREANHLRPGEYIKIVAINRSTGYIGTARVQLRNASERYGDIGTDVPPIIMRPPNLKIWAERTYDIEQGLTTGDDKTYVIGTEGAALTSDTYITIFTEWLDADGTALPDGLAEDNGEMYGLTGRLAKVVGQNQLGAANGVSSSQSDMASFPIPPGRKIQAIHVRSNLTTAEHYYVHVAGKPKDQECVEATTCPNFESDASVEEPYTARPKLLTPFYVPLWNEARQWQEYNAYRALRDSYDEGQTPIEPIKPLPAYAWRLRPEYQFSQFELEMEAINRVELNEDGSENATNVLNANPPTLGGSDDFIKALYSFTASQFDRLTPLDGKLELIFAFGEDEQKITLGEDQTIRFENLAHLASLGSEDFLTMRLYTNNDASNVLWEWAFGSDLLGETDVRIVSADDNSFDLNAYLPIAIDENNLRNVRVQWLVDNGAELAHPTTDSNAGLFSNTLTTSTSPGVTHTVTARVIASDDERVIIGTEVEFSPIIVVAGSPRSVSLSAESQAEVLSSGTDTVRLIATVLDRHGNPVDQDTAVSWHVDYSGTILEEETNVDLNGQASAVYQSGLETIDTEVSVYVNGLTDSITINKIPLDFSASLNSGAFEPGQQGQITIQLSAEPQEPVEIYWQNSHGVIDGPSTVTGNTASASFQVGNLDSSDGYVIVNVAGVRKKVPYQVNVQHQPNSISFEYASIAAGSEDSYQVETLESYISETVVRQTAATVYGTPGETVTLQAGGFYSQNFEPVAIFSMSGFDLNENGENLVLDTMSGLEANVDGAVIWDETESYVMPGSSLHFEGGRLLVEDNDVLDFNTDYYANIRFKPESLSDSTVLLRKGSNDSNGYALTIIEDAGEYRVQARVSTDQGDFFAVSESVLSTDQWYLAGLQLKNGQLTVGLQGERVTVPANGTPNNSGFANNLVIGDGFRGNIDDIKIGQIDESRGTLVLIDGAVLKEITFDSSGEASVTLSGGTATLHNLGSRVGFSIVENTSDITQINERELRYQTAMSRLSLFSSPVTSAYAQTVTQSSDLEGGVAVVDGQAMAEAIDMLKKAGEPALEAIKTAAKFLFEMTSISDVWQLTKAVYLWTHGRFDEVDKIELAFAGIGLTLTIVTVAVTAGTAGTAGPGSIAAMLSVKGALRVLKGTLKEVFRQEPAAILKIGGTAARWTFGLVGNILSGSAGREAAIKQLTDFKDVFIDLIQNGSVAAWEVLKVIGRSPGGLRAYINLRKLRALPCVASSADEYNIWEYYARFSPLYAINPATAYAAPACGPSLADRAMLQMHEVGGMSVIQQEQFASLVERLLKASEDGVSAMKLSEETIDKMATIVRNGQGENLSKFIKNMDEAGNATIMRGFSYANMSRILPEGDTPFDRVIDAMQYLPTSDPDKYQKAFRQLATKNGSNIRGIYGEAVTFKRLKDPDDVLASGTNLRANADSLKIGDDVYWHGRSGVQGPDIDGTLDGALDGPDELVSRSLKLETSGGRPLFVEVKNYTSNYSSANVKAQTKKHLETKIEDLLDEGDPPSLIWRRGQRPRLHYEWMGEGFSSPALRQQRMRDVIEACEKTIGNGKLSRAVPPFDCINDITFNIVDELIEPLTQKVTN